MKKLLVFATLAATLLASCTKDINISERTISFSVSSEQVEDTKLELVDSLKLKFNEGDKLYVLSSDHRIKTGSDTPGTPGYYYNRTPKPFTADDKGVFSGTDPKSEQTEGSVDYFAIFPYNNSIRLQSDNKKNYIPFGSFQLARANDFPLIQYSANDESVVGQPAVVMYGKANGTNIQMKALNSFLKFKVAASNIKEIHIYNTSAKYLAADRMNLDSIPSGTTTPASIVVQSGKADATCVVVRPNDGNTFIPNTSYYVSVVPFSGVIISVALYNTNGQYAKATTSDKVSAGAGKVHKLGGNQALDEILTEWKTTPTDDLVLESDFTQGFDRNNFFDSNKASFEAEKKFTDKEKVYFTDGKNKYSTEIGIGGTEVTIKANQLYIKAKGGVPSIQIPVIVGYTIKKVDITFASYTKSTSAETYLSSNKDHEHAVNAGGTGKIAISNNVTLTSASVVPSGRYFICFYEDKTSGNEYQISKIKFTYSPTSWTGSWD